MYNSYMEETCKTFKHKVNLQMIRLIEFSQINVYLLTTLKDPSSISKGIK